MDDARFLRVAGMDNGSKVVSRVFGAIVEGRYHQLEVRGYNGAEDRIGEEMQAIFDGYAFLKGAAAKPKTGGGGGAPDPGAGGSAAPAEGELSIKFPKVGLTWSLPKPAKEGESPVWAFKAEGNRNLAKGDSGQLARADLSDAAVDLHIELRISNAPAGQTPKDLVGDDEAFRKMMKDNFDGTAVPNVDEQVQIGNWHGASRSYTLRAGQSRTRGKNRSLCSRDRTSSLPPFSQAVTCRLARTKLLSERSKEKKNHEPR